MEGRALPVLLLTGQDRDGNAATATVLATPRATARGTWITICGRAHGNHVGLDAPLLN